MEARITMAKEDEGLWRDQHTRAIRIRFHSTSRNLRRVFFISSLLFLPLLFHAYAE